MSSKRIFSVILCVLIIFASLSGCKPNDDKISKTDIILNTVVTISLFGEKDSGIIDDCFELCREYENKLSRTIATSEISMLNTRKTDTVSDETAELIKKALYYCELSEGRFDITVGGVTSLWDFTSGENIIPDKNLIREAVKHVDYKAVQAEGNKITFSDPYAQLDLGAIAKGYIADKIKEYLLSIGVEHAIISLGGNVLCVGAKPSGALYKVGLQYPYKEQNETISVIEIDDKSVVSSGVYERYFEKDGVLYHHILNPETGYPVENNILSVTIISDFSTDGDALSTICFTLGLEDGMEFINSLDGIYAVYITDDFTVHYSEGMQEVFTITQ